MKKIAHIILLLIAPILLLGAGMMYPSSLGTTTLGSHYVSPSDTKYIFSVSLDATVPVIAMRITPTNGDPEEKHWCFDTNACSLNSYTYDTSEDYIIYASGGTTTGYLLWEPM